LFPNKGKYAKKYLIKLLALLLHQAHVDFKFAMPYSGKWITCLISLFTGLAGMPYEQTPAALTETPHRYVNLVKAWNTATSRTRAKDLLTRITPGAYLPEIDCGLGTEPST
jgi:hypothetical protein